MRLPQLGIVILATIATLGGSTFATGVYEGKFNGNAYLWVSVDGYDPNGDVSGTKVDLPIVRGVALLAGEPGWASADLLWLEIRLTDMPDQTFEPPIPNPNTLAKTLRFASTHYSDGTTVTVGALAYVRLSNGVNEEYDFIECSRDLNIYNKALSWATHEEWIDNVGYVYQANPAAPQYCWAAYEGSKQAWTYLKNTINHQDIAPTSQTDTNIQLEPPIASALKIKTFIFGFTHGEPSGIRASYDDGTTTSAADDDVLPWSNISSYVNGNLVSPRTAPPINMVAMYACSTCSGGSLAASNAFGITVNGQSITNRAYVGFENRVWSACDKEGDPNTIYPLYLHSNLLMSKLSAGGWTIREALDSANDRYRPLVDNDLNNETVMVLKGDPHARICDAYLGAQAGGNPDQNSWYIFP